MQYSRCTRVEIGFQLFCQLQIVGRCVWKLLMLGVLGHTKANESHCQDQVDMLSMDTGAGWIDWANATCLCCLLIVRTSNPEKSWWINLEKNQPADEDNLCPFQCFTQNVFIFSGTNLCILSTEQ